MFQTQPQLQRSSRADEQDLAVLVDMDSSKPSTPQNSQILSLYASCSETTSPSQSLFSRNHTARSGSAPSSISSSPAVGDAFEGFLPTKTLLTDVKEEPLEREDSDMQDTLLGHRASETSIDRAELAAHSHDRISATSEHYDFHELEASDLPLSGSSFKKRRSGDSPASLVSDRISHRFPSFSRKWKTKTGASPKLSIITQPDPTINSRTNSVSSQLISPALSVISQHESLLCASPNQVGLEEGPSRVSLLAPIDIEQANALEEEDQGAATTPLLPPLLMSSSTEPEPVQSPLQSPSVAGTPIHLSSTTPAGTPQLPFLPSPPLSSKPSLASLRQQSRAGTIVQSSEIPILQSLGECENDEWSVKLGHANFTIWPEPYLPEPGNFGVYRDFRESWEQARHNYAKHLARTGEHYGTTSKTFLLTEEKWAEIDAKWKQHNASISAAMGSILTPPSTSVTDRFDVDVVGAVLEQPPTRVVVPKINDPSGKFPDMGDEDIVGPMAVALPRAKRNSPLVDSTIQNRLSKKRNFWKFFSDIIGRGVTSSLRA